MSADGPGHALVLGSSSGFGAAIAQALARQGHPILGVHLDLRRTLAQARSAQAACEAHGVPVVFVNGNATNEAVRAEALAHLPPGPSVDVVVHSLAFGSLKPLCPSQGPSLQPRDLTMTLEVMAHSLVWWVRDLLAGGHLRDGARLFALTSSGSLAAMPAYGAVSAAKAALEAHVRQLAAELAPRRISVNALMPGVCDTPALRAIPGWEALRDAALARNPHGRLTTPEDIAEAVVALRHPGLGWLTGQVIPIDGGETIAAAPFPR